MVKLLDQSSWLTETDRPLEMVTWQERFSSEATERTAPGCELHVLSAAEISLLPPPPSPPLSDALVPPSRPEAASSMCHSAHRPPPTTSTYTHIHAHIHADNVWCQSSSIERNSKQRKWPLTSSPTNNSDMNTHSVTVRLNYCNTVTVRLVVTDTVSVLHIQEPNDQFTLSSWTVLKLGHKYVLWQGTMQQHTMDYIYGWPTSRPVVK